MADKEINDLTDGGYLEDDDLIHVVRTGNSRKAKARRQLPSTPASSSGPASMQFAEDSDNGTNKVTLQAPSALSSDPTVTLPAATGTIALVSEASPERLPTLANNATDPTNDIDFTAGSAWDSTLVSKASLSAMTKRLDADWAPGNGNGGRYKGAAIANTTYHWWACWKAGGADPDYYADPSADASTVLTHLQAETGGSAYLYVRRLGSIPRVSGALVGFVESGRDAVRRFEFTGGPVAVSGSPFSSMGTSAVSRTLNSLPTGVAVLAILHGGFQLNAGETAYGYISALDTTDIAASNTNANIGGVNNSSSSIQVFSTVPVRANTSAQIRTRFSASSAAITLWLNTQGWVDDLAV